MESERREPTLCLFDILPREDDISELSYYLNSSVDVLWHTVTCSVFAGTLVFLWLGRSADCFYLDYSRISLSSISCSQEQVFLLQNCGVSGSTDTFCEFRGSRCLYSRALANASRFQVFHCVGWCLDLVARDRESATGSITFSSGISVSIMSLVCIHSAYLLLRMMAPSSPGNRFLLALLLVLSRNGNELDASDP